MENMKKIILVLSLLVLATNFKAKSQNLVIGTNPPPPVNSVSATAIGVTGGVTYFYWVVANYPIGSVAPTSSARVDNSNGTLTGGNFNRISWNLQGGATNYTIVRTTTNTFPGTCASCLVTTSATAPISDNGGALTSFTFSGVNPAQATIFIDNSSSSLPRLKVNFLNNRIIGWGQDRGTTDPSVCLTGELFYNTTSDAMKECNNAGSWVVIGTGGGGGNTVTCATNGGVTCTTLVNNVDLAADPAIVAFKSAAAGGQQSGTSALNCISSSASGTTYTAACATTLSAYVTHQQLNWTCDTTSTGAATINIDTLGAKPLKQSDGSAIAASTLVCPNQYPIWYDGTNFRVMTVGNGGGGGTTYYSQFINTGSTAMTGSNVTMATFSNVPALAAGSCYHFNGGYAGSANFQVEIKVDGTTISTPLPLGAGFAGFYYFWHSDYCNDPGTQATQTLRYQANPTFIGIANYSAPNIPQLGAFEEPPLSTPSAFNWASTHTITVIMNAASGTGIGYFGIN